MIMGRVELDKIYILPQQPINWSLGPGLLQA